MGQHGPRGDRSWAPRSREQGVCGPSTVLWRGSNSNSFLRIQDQAPLLALWRTTSAPAGQEHQLPEAWQGSQPAEASSSRGQSTLTGPTTLPLAGDLCKASGVGTRHTVTDACCR